MGGQTTLDPFLLEKKDWASVHSAWNDLENRWS